VASLALGRRGATELLDHSEAHFELYAASRDLAHVVFRRTS
jgi:hypothetical protein